MKTLDLKFPKGWEELSARQLKYIFKLLAGNFTKYEIKIFCLFRWNNITVIAQNGRGEYWVKASIEGKKELVILTSVQLAEVLPFLKWIEEMPETPVRLPKVGIHKGLTADFSEVPFEKFIMADNLYHGYLEAVKMYGAESDKALFLVDSLGYVLYGTTHFNSWQRINCFYWFSSVKLYFSRLFPDFFQPAGNGEDTSGSHSVKDAMNAQIRALTKGDITKEREVLLLDTWRALTELNAQAKEYKELNAKMNKR